MTVRGTHGPRRRAREAAVMEQPRRIFFGIRCDLCRAGLHDTDGRPRWDVLGRNPLLFICPDGCKDCTGGAR